MRKVQMNILAAFGKYAFIRSLRFDGELKKLVGDMPRVDEFVRGVEWVLCRNPEEGMLVAGAPHFIRVVFCGLYSHADIGVYYAVRGEHVHLLSIYNCEEAE